MSVYFSRRSSLSFLRAVIREVAMGLDDMDPDYGMGLAVINDGASRYYILYTAGFMVRALATWEDEARIDAEKGLKSLKAKYKRNKDWGPFPYDAPAARKKWIKDAASDFMRRAVDTWWESAREDIQEDNFVIVAMMKVYAGRSKKYPQWDASTVELSAAWSGWGPFMYDVVMSLEGGLVPDRSSVSDSARGVWRKYKDSRPDVKAKPLDDADNPRTKTTQDDTNRMHPDDAPKGKLPENPLNYAYFLKSGAPNVSTLISNHRAAEPVLRKYGVDIVSLASQLFSVKYNR